VRPPFADLVVVDAATLAAAPEVAAFFGDFGARVVKVEHPRGDSLRQLVDAHGAAITWKIVNRNKECITCDLERPAGRALFERLLARADVLVTNAGPDRLARFELDAAALRARHARLVTVNLTAWGIGGPWAERPGSGTLAEAAAGLASLTGADDGPPGLSPVGLGDRLGVQQAIIAALMGLWTRDGAWFDVAMYEPVLGLLGQRLAQTVRAGVEPGRHGNRFPTMAARNTYRTADGEWVALTAGTDALVRRVFAVIGRPELADDARFRTNQGRLAHVAELDALVGGWIAARRRAEVVEAFTGAGVSLAGVDGLLDVAKNPHFRARGSLADVDDADGGGLTTAAPSPHGAGGAIRWLGRARGADNHAVFGEWLGLAAGELAALEREGVV
jgi:crotonobetainyl-CoA:carnitine CoA-transferase CaiB-like acyl-CoA transferase